MRLTVSGHSDLGGVIPGPLLEVELGDLGTTDYAYGHNGCYQKIHDCGFGCLRRCFWLLLTFSDSFVRYFGLRLASVCNSSGREGFGLRDARIRWVQERSGVFTGANAVPTAQPGSKLYSQAVAYGGRIRPQSLSS